MKVLQLNTAMNIGGIGNYILSLSSKLSALRAEVVIASSGGTLEPEMRSRDLCHIRIDLDTKFEFHPKVLLSALELRRIVTGQGIDVIHAHSRVSQVAAALVSRLTGVPYVTTCHGYFKKRWRGIFDTWGRFVIAISEAVRQHLENDLGVDAARIKLVYSGVDADRFEAQAASCGTGKGKRELGLGDGPVVGSIGRLSPVKGQKYLLHAMADIMPQKKDVRLLVVGNGPDERSLKALAMALGIEAKTVFVDADTDTPKYLGAIDVFVFPSVKEGLGIGLLEAMAAGRACVASRVGGIENVITDGFNGVLVEPADIPDLSLAISRLIYDPQARADMGKNARETVLDRFSLDRMAKEVMSVYSEALAR